MTIILDANLLVLLVVGTYSRDLIGRHRRLRGYTADDFDLLIEMLSKAVSVIVTPNVLTEASNLLGYMSDPARSQIYQCFQAFISTPQIEERFVESRAAASRNEFIRLGLTDCAVLHLAIEDHTLLTADLDLYLAALMSGMKAENFNHYRRL